MKLPDPLHDKVLIKKEKESEETAGGIIIPNKEEEGPKSGEVVAAGEGKPLPNNQTRKLLVKKDDFVLFNDHDATELTYEGEDYYIIKEEDILAIL